MKVFFEIEDGGVIYKPLGFVIPPQPPKSVTWRPDSKRVLLGCGTIAVEYVPPVAETFEYKERETYKLSPQELNQRILTPSIPPEPEPFVPEVDYDSDEEEEEGEEQVVKEEKKEVKPGPDVFSVLIYSNSGDGSFYAALQGGLDHPAFLNHKFRARRAAGPRHRQWCWKGGCQWSSNHHDSSGAVQGSSPCQSTEPSAVCNGEEYQDWGPPQRGWADAPVSWGLG